LEQKYLKQEQEILENIQILDQKDKKKDDDICDFFGSIFKNL
jgi:hypothetical protein